jgi:hypothetical protein
MPFCPNCGIPVVAGQNFCPSCGQKLNPIPSSSVVQPVVPQFTPTVPQPISAPIYSTPSQNVPSANLQERIFSIVPNLKKPKSFGRWDTYNLIVTERRCIFALLTGDMLNRAIKEANEQGKQQGKGFMDRWGDQLSASMGYWKRYETIEPESALRENKENFSFDRSTVRKTNVNHKERSGPNRNSPRVHYWEVSIETVGGNYKFESDADPSDPMRRAFG